MPPVPRARVAHLRRCVAVVPCVFEGSHGPVVHVGSAPTSAAAEAARRLRRLVRAANAQVQEQTPDSLSVNPAHQHGEQCHGQHQLQAQSSSAAGSFAGCPAPAGTRVLEVNLLNGGLLDPANQPANLLFSELLSDWRELPAVPSPAGCDPPHY